MVSPRSPCGGSDASVAQRSLTIARPIIYQSRFPSEFAKKEFARQYAKKNSPLNFVKKKFASNFGPGHKST
jgi:hypothetical protein